MKKESFAKLNPTALGLSVGVLAFLVTILMGGYGMMGYGMMGYSTLSGGAVIASLWMGIISALLSGGTAWIYNWMLSRI